MEWPPNYADIFWSEFPRRVAKQAAMKALDKVRKSGVSFEKVIAGVRIYARTVAGKDIQFVCHPATWLNQGRWDDEQSHIGAAQPTTTANAFGNLLARALEREGEGDPCIGPAQGFRRH